MLVLINVTKCTDRLVVEVGGVKKIEPSEAKMEYKTPYGLAEFNFFPSALRSCLSCFAMSVNGLKWGTELFLALLYVLKISYQSLDNQFWLKKAFFDQNIHFLMSTIICRHSFSTEQPIQSSQGHTHHSYSPICQRLLYCFDAYAITHFDPGNSQSLLFMKNLPLLKSDSFISNQG